MAVKTPNPLQPPAPGAAPQAPNFSFGGAQSSGVPGIGGNIQNPYAGNLDSALGASSQNYANIMKLMNGLQSSIGKQNQNLYGSYGGLQSQVLSQLGAGKGGWGAYGPAANQIQRNLTTSLGAQQ